MKLFLLVRLQPCFSTCKVPVAWKRQHNVLAIDNWRRGCQIDLLRRWMLRFKDATPRTGNLAFLYFLHLANVRYFPIFLGRFFLCRFPDNNRWWYRLWRWAGCTGILLVSTFFFSNLPRSGRIAVTTFRFLDVLPFLFQQFSLAACFVLIPCEMFIPGRWFGVLYTFNSLVWSITWFWITGWQRTAVNNLTVKFQSKYKPENKT